MAIRRSFFLFFAFISLLCSALPGLAETTVVDQDAVTEPVQEPVSEAGDAPYSKADPFEERDFQAGSRSRVEAPPLWMPAEGETVSVYVIPITGPISKPNVYILRRGLKEAISEGVDMVILDMDTPGGRVDLTIEIMEMLRRFEGLTATYVNEDAISAGSFIAAVTQEIYFAPMGKMGASAVVQGGGQDVPEAMRMKIESYLRANLRVTAEAYPYRSNVVRAMMEADYEFEIDGEVLKPAGELLTLTASEAVREYGDPPYKLLAEGIYPSVEALLEDRFGAGNYEIKDFKLTYSEGIAKWMNTFASALMGIGILCLFIEFKTPGFGFFGIAGLILIGVFFISQYIAGLAGNEVILIFVLGVLLVFVEIFLFPGTFVFAISGLLMMVGSLLWAMVDVWPGEPIQFDADTFAKPLVDLFLGLGVAVFGAILAARLLPGSFVERRLVLADTAGGDSRAVRAERESRLPQPGSMGTALTDLYPVGRVEVAGARFQARSAMNMIDRGARVRVVRTGDFDLIVEEVKE